MVAALSFERDAAVGTAVAAVIAAGRDASDRGWVPATSGNFSVRIDNACIAITASGVAKGALTPSDVLVQDLHQPLHARSSAEAALHVSCYANDPHAQAVFHIHGLYSTVISQAHAAEHAVELRGWELQKALAGVSTHDVTVEVPVFANDQDVAALAARVTARFAQPVAPDRRRAPGYLIAGHGLYAWGRSAGEAARHVEALEILFQQIITLRSYQS